MGRRYSRWKNFRGKSRAGKPGVSTFRAFKKRGWIEPEDEGVGTWRISELGTEIAQSTNLEDDYYRPRKVKVTANDVLQACGSYYSQMGMDVIPEVSIAHKGERRVDGLVVGRGNETAIVLEVKVDRGDFQHELDNPEKRVAALGLCSQYFFAAPQGMIKPNELPQEAGLLEMDKRGKIHPTVPAPHRRPGTPDWRLCGAIARALKR